jgi:hypothetical protein
VQFHVPTFLFDAEIHVSEEIDDVEISEDRPEGQRKIDGENDGAFRGE